MRKIILVRNYCIPFILPFLAACGDKTKKIEPRVGANRQQIVMAVDAYIAKTEPFSENIEVPGSVIANETTEIHPEVSGRHV